MAIYFSADLHINESLNGENVHDKLDRIINNWNNVVNKKDKIFLLGDLGHASKKHFKNIFTCLKGTKYLILGNHDLDFNSDEKWWYSIGFKSVSKFPIIYDNRYLLSHQKQNTKEFINIHGHTHTELDWGENTFNVASCLHENCLVPLDYIKNPYKKNY